MCMQKILAYVLLFVVMLSAVHAKQTAGISPDNAILWRLDIFFEHTNVFITYDQTKKIEKRMQSAEERAAEMEKMLRWKRTAEAEKAKVAYEKELAAVNGSVAKLEYSRPQSEFEAEYVIDSLLQSSQEELVSITTAMHAADLDDSQKQLVQQFSALTLDDIQEKLKEKKDATVLKLKANGLTDENIAALEQDILSSLEAVKDEVQGTEESGQEEVKEQQVEETESVVEQPAESEKTMTEESEEKQTAKETNKTAEPIAVVADTSSKNKVKVDGELTAEQLQAVNLLYSQLVAENTDAEIEVTVMQMDNGLWKVEKEVDGILTSLQSQQLDNLLVSLSQEPSSVHIKVKYDSAEPEGTGVYVGQSGDIETAFVIG